MKAVLTVLGPTPDSDAGLPGAVRELCINTAAVDPFTSRYSSTVKTADCTGGDLSANKLSDALTLTGGLEEGYTPTVLGVDGTIYAINRATLFAIGDD
jgi:hypothetical protein